MSRYTKEALTKALLEINSTISKCEKIHGKFKEGTSSHTLLKNRIKAMYISKLLLENELAKLELVSTNEVDEVPQKSVFEIKNVEDYYTKEDLSLALPPVSSIISKCEKAQSKFVEGTTHHTRFSKIIQPMYLAKALIVTELSKMD